MKSSITCPYVEAHGIAGKHRPTKIVIRSTGNTCVEGSALGVALAWNKQSYSSGSAHYVVDSVNVYQTAWDDLQICGDDRGALVVAVNVPFQKADDFLRHDLTLATLDKAATVVAALSEKYKIPVRYLDDEGQRKWSKFKTRRRGGITISLSAGEWPEALFLNFVGNKVLELRTANG